MPFCFPQPQAISRLGHVAAHTEEILRPWATRQVSSGARDSVRGRLGGPNKPGGMLSRPWGAGVRKRSLAGAA